MADNGGDYQQPVVGAGPNQDIYEVDKIIDGPRKRREYNFVTCYKVRWKHFGKDADSWQPISDLENVMYMIDEYNDIKNTQKEMRQEKRKNQKAEAQENDPRSGGLADSKPNQAENEKEEPYNPLFGKLKDRFWKKLELGLLDEEVFEGDMYSKVKGSRRAAHADAAERLQQHQKSTSGSKSDPVKSEPAEKQRRPSKSSTPLSSQWSESSNIRSAVKPGSATKTRKRSCDPFSARGYMSAKRSRRSREMKRSNVTSVTVRMVSLPNEESAQDKSDFSEPREQEMGQEAKDDSDDEAAPTEMTVTSETVFSVTTEEDSFTSEESSSKPEADNNCTSSSGNLDNGASGDITTDAETSSKDTCENGATSGVESSSGTSDCQTSPTAQRSTSEVQAEASGAVEKSHDEECLWGGACNRSDCKSNRRWNMKNGKDQSVESNNDVPVSTANTSASASSAQNTLPLTQVSSLSTSPNPKDSKVHSNTVSPTSLSPTSSQVSTITSPLSSARKALFYGSPDSSLDEGGSASLDKDAVIDSLAPRIDALAHRMHMDTIVGSSSGLGNLLSNAGLRSDLTTSVRVSSTVSRKSSGYDEGVERPGLFSDKSAFSFMRQGVDGSSSLSMSDGSIHSHIPGGSVSHASPGKENFSTASGENTKDNMTTHLSSSRLQGSTEAPENSQEQDRIVSNPGLYSSYAPFSGANPIGDTWSQRKRTGDMTQPLEKIPSPNSRRDTDLDKRIATMTCDELEDMEVQGEEGFSRKDAQIITNADLYQAVSLGKAEVVRRAINQSSNLTHRLDFEQTDNAGFTILMRAVQKGSVPIVEMLLENGAKVNAQQVTGLTALMMAAEQREICLVALLLKHGANSSLYTVTSDLGETALVKAIKKQNREVVNLMLRTGVNFAAPSCSSMSALQVAVERRNPQIENTLRSHVDRLTTAFENKVLETLKDTARLLDKLFSLHCFPLRESQDFVIKFNGNLQPMASGEGYLLFIAHTKINERGVRCRFHGSCPIASVTLNGVLQSPLTKEVNFVTSCHPVVPGCNTLVIAKHTDYNSKAKLLVCAYRARLLVPV